MSNSTPKGEIFIQEYPSFKVETTLRQYPCYAPNFNVTQADYPHIKKRIRVLFEDGTILSNYSGDWIYDNVYFESFDKLVDSLPIHIQEVIFFNLEIFRKI